MNLSRSSLLPTVGSFSGVVFAVFWLNQPVFVSNITAAKLANTVLNYLNRSTIYWAQKAILLTCLALLSPQVVRVILCTAHLENCGPRAKKAIKLKREM